MRGDRSPARLAHASSAFFRKVLAEKTDLNPYLLEVANIREQCSWVHKDKQIGTPKAINLVAMAVAKADCDTQLFTHEIPVTKRALIIGGGIAGIQAAPPDIADAGFPRDHRGTQDYDRRQDAHAR